MTYSCTNKDSNTTIQYPLNLTKVYSLHRTNLAGTSAHSGTYYDYEGINSYNTSECVCRETASNRLSDIWLFVIGK